MAETKLSNKEILQWLELNDISEVFFDEPVIDLKLALASKAKNAPVSKNTSTPKQAIQAPAPTILQKISNQILQDQASTIDAIAQARKLADKATSLEELREAVLNFTGCSLRLTATNTVFADGNINAPIMAIGEAPGQTEDLRGIPFCGESGQLLDSAFKAAGITRDNNLYISNTVFWRPPQNRTPTDEEIEICRPFVEKHIALKKPKLLVLVGGVAVKLIMGKDKSIANVRQTHFKYEYQNQYTLEPIKVCGVFHPAYLLRNPSKKKDLWQDLLKIKYFITNIA